MSARHSLKEQMEIFERDDDLFLKVTRDFAVALCKLRGSVTADDVRRLYRRSYPHVQWRKAAGAIFKDVAFEPTGEYRKSTIKERRGGRSLVWRLRTPRLVDQPVDGR